MPLSPRQCPCFSGQRYGTCCAPYHRGDGEPGRPSELVRARFAAFSLGLGPYLLRTLTADHPDHGGPFEDTARQLSRVRENQRFLGLLIVDETVAKDDGEVLFIAKIFSKGTDLSFAECSRFTREERGWRYASGLVLSQAAMSRPLASLTPEALRTAARQTAVGS